VKRLAIFGSRARGDARDGSDLDVLIDVDPEAGFEGLRFVGVVAGAERTVAAATGIRTRRPSATGWNRVLRSASRTT
jgi:hypothetical protein